MQEPGRIVVSQMGRVASVEQLRQFPELGGFEVECVTPAYTALNKFDALHRRAALGHHDGIAQRGRDLYDLARIALSEHARQVRPLLDAAAERVARPLSRRRPVARPADGYAASPVFAAGTPACEALRSGYTEAVAELVWGTAPAFEDAIELAVSLDA